MTEKPIRNAQKNSKKFFKKLDIQIKSESEVTQSCLAVSDPMDCSLPGSSVHGIFQARVQEWVAIFFSRGSSQPRDQTQFSHIVGRHFYHLSHQGSHHTNKR